MNFYARIEQLLSNAESDTGLSKHRILLESGIDPSQYRSYQRAGRLLSKHMLVCLANSPHCPISLNTLLAWKALAEYGEEAILEAAALVNATSKASRFNRLSL